MPYSYLVQLPGLNFMRTPGRFMLMGHIGLIIPACFGLQWLLSRWPRYSLGLIGLLTGLILLEGWPQPWPQETLLPVPPFYEQIAADEELYGVLDLPVRPTPYAWQTAFGSFYQIYQMTHHKGIAYGYISRVPSVHPMFPCFFPEPHPPEPDVLVNGNPTDCAPAIQNQLAYYNYRYVVWHKPQPWSPWGYESGSLGEEESLAFLHDVFGNQAPYYEDDLTRVYTVQATTNPPTFPLQMGLDDNWYDFEGNLRWATSPATLFISTATATDAVLELTPAMMYTPDGGWYIGSDGMMTITLDNEVVLTPPIHADEGTAVPLALSSGTHLIKLELAAGNFRPSDYEETEDQREPGFALRSINLRTED